MQYTVYFKQFECHLFIFVFIYIETYLSLWIILVYYIMLYPLLTQDVYINKLSKVAFFQLRCIAQLHSYVSPKDAESLVHAFITSHVDYCIALFAGLPPLIFFAYNSFKILLQEY